MTKTQNNNLTKCEVGVLKLVAEGKQDKEIAALLFVSTRTVAFHIHNVNRKLGTHKRMDAVRAGVAAGWIRYVTASEVTP